MSFRDEKGRLLPGHKFLGNQATQPEPQDNSSPDIPAGDFDDDLIAAANSFGTTRTKLGRRAWCENLRDTRPIEFATLVSKALARKAEAANTGSGAYSVQVCFSTAPAGMCVDENGKLIPEADAKTAWESRNGMEISEPPDQPPPKPVLVSPVEDEPSPPAVKPARTREQLARLSGAEFAAALASGEVEASQSAKASENEITFGGDEDEDDDPPSRHQRPGINMNDMLRSIPKPRFRRKRDDEW